MPLNKSEINKNRSKQADIERRTAAVYVVRYFSTVFNSAIHCERLLQPGSDTLYRRIACLVGSLRI